MIKRELRVRQILAPDQSWDVAYPALGALVRQEILQTLPEGEILSMTQLADDLIRTKDKDPAKVRLFVALRALAMHGLADCATRKPPCMKRIMGKMVESRPWVWHAPRADYVWPAKTEEAPGPTPISPTFAWVDIETFKALEARVAKAEATLQLQADKALLSDLGVFPHTPASCPSKHWNNGEDICADCGADLQATGEETDG